MIGKLVTDEELRRRFLRAPHETLAELAERGWDLTAAEIDALIETDSQVWNWVAVKLPSRLQRCSLRSDAPPERG